MSLAARIRSLGTRRTRGLVSAPESAAPDPWMPDPGRTAAGRSLAGTCGTCLHWAASLADPSGARACMRIKTGRETDRQEDPAWVEDSDDYVAILYTKPQFTCLLWRENIALADEEEAAEREV